MPLLQQRRGQRDGLHLFINDWLIGKKDLIGLQIGSYRGESTEMFVKSNAFKIFYCIDPWEPGYDPKDLASTPEIVLAEQDFDRRFKNNEIIKKIKMKSTDAINLFQDLSLDFIYIDGCHQYEAVKEDLKNYFPKVKLNGMVCGHDYNYAPFPGVTQAVNEFFNKTPLKVYPEGSWIHIKN